MKLLMKSVAFAAALGAASLASAQSWPVYGGDNGNQRFSQGSQITPANVSKLNVKWALQLGSNRSQESSPILVGDTLYVTSSFGPKNVFAVNAKTGEVRWKWSPEMPKGVEQYACCDVNNRGVAYNDGKIFVGRLDAKVTALDAKSGKEMWTQTVVDYTQGSVAANTACVVLWLLWTKPLVKKCGAPTPCPLATKRMPIPGRVTLAKQVAVPLGTWVHTIPS